MNPCYLGPRLARWCTVVLAMSGNCAVSGLRNREVSAIEGALIHTGIGSCIWDLLIVRYKEVVRHSGVSVKRGSLYTPNQHNHTVTGYDGQTKSCPYNVYDRL